MQIPAGYTNPELAEYMQRVIGPLSGILDLTVEGQSFDNAIGDALAAYGVQDAADASDIPRLRAYAQREAWRLVRDMTVGYYDLRSPDGEQLNRSQLHAHAVAMFNEAERRVGEFEGTYSVQRFTVRRIPDPYNRSRTNGEWA